MGILNRTYLFILLLAVVVHNVISDELSFNSAKFDNVGSEIMSDDPNKIKSGLANIGFIHAFVASLSVILVSELGDKTFFIAAIMAMRHPRLTVFAGAIGALAFMTILSAVFGMAATFIPRVYTYYISAVLFALFGLKMLWEGYHMTSTEGQEELEEVQMDIRKREDELLKTLGQVDGGTGMNKKTDDNVNDNQSISDSNHETINNRADSQNESELQSSSSQSVAGNQVPSTSSTSDNQHHDSTNASQSDVIISTVKTRHGSNTNMDLKQLNKNGMKRVEKEIAPTLLTDDPEAGENVVRKQKRNVAWYLASRVLMQSFTMTFLAEWGDRSQLTTVILSARENVYGVIVGGILGHSLCTGLAVLGGRMIAQKISVRTVTLVGGAVFLIFAISAFIISPDDI